MKSLSLVIPAYKAEGLLERILSHVPTLADVATKVGFQLIETIVVDDGNVPAIDASRLGSVQVGSLTVIRNDRNRGKGFSVKRGALCAKGDYVLMSDADESVPLSEFAVLAKHLDYALVCGCRRTSPDSRPLIRRILSRLFSILTGTTLKDTQCGFKLFNMSQMRKPITELKTERFAFDVELIRNAPSVISECVEWHGGRRSSLRVWKDAPRMLWDLVKIRLS